MTIDSRTNATMGVHRFEFISGRLYTRPEAASVSPRVTALLMTSIAAALRLSATVALFCTKPLRPTCAAPQRGKRIEREFPSRQR